MGEAAGEAIVLRGSARRPIARRPLLELAQDTGIVAVGPCRSARARPTRRVEALSGNKGETRRDGYVC